MNVRNLINNLLEFPMDTEIIISIQSRETADYDFAKADFVVDYENNTVGIVGKEEEK